MQETARDVYQLVRSAGAKLAGHWPTLIALLLAGFAAKLATLKLALLAGELAWALGVLIFAFTAAGLLAAVTMMFRSVFPGRPRPQFALLLAPFLVIYLATSHFDGYQINPALERPVTMDVAAASVLAGAIVLRWLMPLWPVLRTQRWATWARVALDICWMSLVAFTITTHPLSQWLAEVADPVSWVFSTVFAVLVVPLAWLVVGSLALGLRPSELLWPARRAGILLILATCLIILILQKIPLLLWEIERLVLGSQDPQTFWQPFSGLLGAANSAVGVLLIVCVVAAFLAYSGADVIPSSSDADPYEGGTFSDGTASYGTASGGYEPGISGQRGAAHDANSDWFGVRGRDKEDGDLIGI